MTRPPFCARFSAFYARRNHSISMRHASTFSHRASNALGVIPARRVHPVGTLRVTTGYASSAPAAEDDAGSFEMV